jgi:hypothetical protein
MLSPLENHWEVEWQYDSRTPGQKNGHAATMPVDVPFIQTAGSQFYVSRSISQTTYEQHHEVEWIGKLPITVKCTSSSSVIIIFKDFVSHQLLESMAKSATAMT